MNRVLPRQAAAPAPSRAPASGVAHQLLRASRPKQWSKNVLVLAAPFAAGVLTNGESIKRVGAAFAIFCCLASATYLLNDVVDASADRQHPVKRLRPVASGALSVPLALATSLALFATALGTSSALGWRMLVVSATYAAIQFAYCLWLKHEPVFDLACVASGFVLRAIAGGVAARLPISQWFLIVATFGALLMVSGKRLAEYRHLGDQRGAHRPSLDGYSETFLQGIAYMSAAVATTAYCLWAFERQGQVHGHPNGVLFQLSIVPFVLGLLRYTFEIDAGRGSAPEDVIFSDRALQAVGLVWLALFGVGVYAY
jgi:decaprenyl-phosphate phosphoribosyltransferase